MCAVKVPAAVIPFAVIGNESDGVALGKHEELSNDISLPESKRTRNGLAND